MIPGKPKGSRMMWGKEALLRKKNIFLPAYVFLGVSRHFVYAAARKNDLSSTNSVVDHTVEMLWHSTDVTLSAEPRFYLNTCTYVCRSQLACTPKVRCDTVY